MPHRHPTLSTKQSSTVCFVLLCCADYKVSLGSVPEGDKAAREQQLHACHQRSADKLLKLCFDNGGIYIKLGQHIGQLVREHTHVLCLLLGCQRVTSFDCLDTIGGTHFWCHMPPCAVLWLCCAVAQDHLLPEEYVLTMRQHMLDRCPVSSYAEVRQIISEDLGAPPEQLFSSFSEAPIASASLAQVSRGSWVSRGLWAD